MPSLQNIVLTDRATTPVNHTYTPADRDQLGKVGILEEYTGVPGGAPRLTISMKDSSTGKKKGRLTLTVPVVQTETINGVARPVVVRTSYANLEFTFDALSTEQERNDMVGMLASALGTTKVLVHDAFVKGQGIY